MALSDKVYDELVKGITDQEPKYFKGLLWGEGGTRKTSTTLRCRKLGTRAVLLHADRGWNIIHNHPDEFGGRGCPDIVPIAYQGLSQVRALIGAIKDDREPFHNVSLISWDTVSQSSDEYLNFLLENAKWSGNYREKASAKSIKSAKAFKDVIAGEDEVVEVPGQPDYHTLYRKMSPVIKELVKAPVDVMFVTHVREPSPLNPTDMLWRPNLTDKVWKEIFRNATFVGYCQKDQGKYTINFKPDRKTAAKSQILSMDDKIIQTDSLPTHIQEWREL